MILPSNKLNAIKLGTLGQGVKTSVNWKFKVKCVCFFPPKVKLGLLFHMPV